MNPTVAKAAVVLVPAIAVLVVSVTQYTRDRRLASLLKIVGSLGFVTVAFTHIAEGLQVFPVMHWGAPDSAGHYLDLSAVLVGLVCLPLGFLLRRLDSVSAAQRNEASERIKNYWATRTGRNT